MGVEIFTFVRHALVEMRPAGARGTGSTKWNTHRRDWSRIFFLFLFNIYER